MLLLFALLSSGVVRVEWLAPGATLLTKHLAFFFIPITVGLPAFSELFLRSGAAILTVLALSMAAGICAAGFTSQALSRRIAARKGGTT
jgi:holin-like protein